MSIDKESLDRFAAYRAEMKAAFVAPKAKPVANRAPKPVSKAAAPAAVKKGVKCYCRLKSIIWTVVELVGMILLSANHGLREGEKICTCDVRHS